MTTSTETSTIALDSIRLHITPFNEDIFERIIPDSLRRTSKPSYHKLQTFPERDYGFVELPQSEAEKLKKKLNGLILKGQKVSIEEARPMPKRKSDAVEAEKAERKRARKDAKAKDQNSVINGHQLEEGRHVKRGWTEDKQKRKKAKSKDEAVNDDIGDKHTLFKTVVPPNKVDVKDKKDGKSKKPGKSKKNEAVVEEFAKSKKSFVTGKAGATVGEVVGFEDGKGWVDVDGNVVEAVKSQRRNADLPGQRLAARPLPSKTFQEPVQDQIEENGHDLNDQDQDENNGQDEIDLSEQDLSSSDEDDSSESGIQESDIEPVLTITTTRDESESSEPQSATSDDDASSAEEAENETELVSATTVSDTREVHPLEALYKRKSEGDNKLQLAPLQTSFSFFPDPQQGAGDQEIGEDADMRPITPYTTQDMEYRRRSAAPTPDTAAIGGRFGFPFGGSESDEAEDDDAEDQADDTDKDAAATGNREESAFRKFFYEKRGETDRAWRKRRRDARRLQRQRENRRLSRRIV